MVTSPTMRIEGRYFAEGCTAVGGIDEVGRGAWAGPVSVGVVVVTPGSGRKLPSGVRDSKQLTLVEREALFVPVARAVASWAVGHASNEECDELGMTCAQRLATRRALDQLDVVPDMLLLDGKFDFLNDGEAALPVRMIVRGDSSSKAIAAASILAKVTRDRLMAKESEHYPWYGFERNRGYPSPSHKMALAAWGCTPFHRRSWAFVEGLLFRPAGYHDRFRPLAIDDEETGGTGR
ncbi:MAG: ribonuclease HII [Acidimicrobiales bacterium]